MYVKKLNQDYIPITGTITIQPLKIMVSSIFYKTYSYPSYQDGKNIIDGDTYYYLNNKIHNTEGPAVIKKDGAKLYYIQGELLHDINDDESLKRYIDISLFK